MLDYPSGVLTQYESCVCWDPMVTIINTYLRVGPDDKAPSRLFVPMGKRCGRQSRLNPKRIPMPELRPAVNGYLWVYNHMTGLAGWMDEGSLRRFSDVDAWATGPAHKDFQRGSGRPKDIDPPKYTLGESVKGIRIVKARDVYLRSAPHSSGIWILVKGDRIEYLWQHPTSGENAVRVIKAKWCPAGTIGWLQRQALRRRWTPVVRTSSGLASE